MTRPSRKPTKTEQKELADSIFAMRVRMRGACERCGKTPRDGIVLQCSHIQIRDYFPVRWDFSNALCLCKGCHFWWHHYPVQAEAWCRELIGDEAYDDLRMKAIAKTKTDYDAVLAYLTSTPPPKSPQPDKHTAKDPKGTRHRYDYASPTPCGKRVDFTTWTLTPSEWDHDCEKCFV